MNQALRFVNSWVLPPFAIAALQILIYQLSESGFLPNPLAIHWGFGLMPDGFASTSEFALTALIMQFALWSPIVIAEIWPKPKIRIKSIILFTLIGLYWMVTTILVLSVVIQIGALDAATVPFPIAVFVFLLLGLPFVLVFFLSLPTIVVGEGVEIKLRGLTVMSLTREEILSATEGMVSAREFGGLGLRVTSRRIGFVPSKGSSVNIQLQDGTEVLVRSKNPKDVVRLIQELVC